MAAPPPLALKRSYRCVSSLQQFYSGGPFAVSSDGASLACACGDEIKIVNSSDASVLASLGGDSESVTAFAFSPDGCFLFSAGHSRLIRVWDLSSRKCARSWKGHDGPVMSMACHSSGGLLATGGADRKLFSGSDDASVRVWNLESKKCVAVLEKHFSPVTSLALSEDGQILLSTGRDKVVNKWDLHNYSFNMTIPTYEMVETVCSIQPGNCLSALLEPSGHRKPGASAPVYFLTVGERGIVRLFCNSAVCLYEQQSSDVTLGSDEDDLRRGFLSAVVLPSDLGLLCVTADQQFLFYRPMKSPKGMFQLNLYKRLVGYNEEILDMKFLGDDEQYLAVATNLEQVRVYDVASMSCAYVLVGHTDIVVCIDTCISTYGRTMLVTGSKDNSVRLWDVESRHCIGIGRGHMGAVGAVAFSKKWKNFLVSGSSDRTIKVWSFEGVSEDGDQEIALKAKAVVAAHDKDINSLAVSPNDSLVCSGSEDHTACIWRLPDLVSVAVLKGHKRGIWSVEFSPVDQCVITSSGDRTIKIWAVSDGSCLKTFEGHTSSVLRASFLSRGTQFVSCGGDGLIKLWTIKTSECIATYDQHEGKIWALAVGKKTEMLVTGGTDALINFWHDSTAADKQEAFLREEEAILRAQDLENAVSDADYTRAIQLAFELRRPHKLFDLFSHLCRRRDVEDPMEKALGGLGKEEIHVLLEYVREWNTKPKLCHVAQAVLFRMFRIFPPTDIAEVKGVGELLEGLIPYSQRHFSRIDRFVRSTFLLDYVLTRMSVVDPEEETNLPNNGQHPLASENGVADEQDAPQNKSQVDDMSCKGDTGKSSTSNETDGVTSLKKRKSTKSKKRSAKKVKLTKHNKNNSTVPVEA
ncbi:Utp13 specific WD40 associated domain [Musa troglodytarum]|uniref:Utp13 specific WD40 associated domain n=1 Tax=Musa troglodytarum TaxID=320322 RepID=A0A9E7ET54_9LILI|nr:Utp13 specific WD40 associated domain [Musa troglodytarum]